MFAPLAWFKQGLPAQRLTPTRILFLGYILIIGIGSGLLLLPFATTGDGISWVDAVFTATSATSITGLIVLDTPHDFTLFGQCVILGLIQIGGIGYMTIAALFVIILGRRIGMQERLLLQEALNVMSPEGILRQSHVYRRGDWCGAVCPSILGGFRARVCCVLWHLSLDLCLQQRRLYPLFQ
jgi:Trk-type K+ transport system membrane component